MALRYEVSDLADVDEAHRDHYAKTEAGTFRLELAGYESPDQLREALRAEKAGTQRALSELARLKKQAAEAEQRQTEDAKQAAQLQAEREAQLNAEFEQRNAQKLTEFKASQQSLIDGMRADRDRTAIEWAAKSLAARIARQGCIELLLPHIRERLTVQEDGSGAYAVGVKDLPSLDHLAEELRADPAFERILVGTSPAEKAAHARRVAETIGAKAAPQPLTRAQFGQLTPEKRAEHARSGATISDG